MGILFFLIICTILFVGKVVEVATCILDDKNENIFDWTQSVSNMHPSINDTIFFRNKLYKNCTLNNYLDHPKLYSHTNRKVVLILGDSIDRSPCFYMSQRPEHFLLVPKKANNCSHLYLPAVDILFASMYGVLSENTTILFENLKSSMTTLPTHISFNSFAHDLKVEYGDFCQQFKSPIVNKAHWSCLCNTTMRRHDCEASSTEIFEALDLPWCSNAVHVTWEVAFIRAVEMLHRIFPGALIYLRTNPPSALIFMGNRYCQNYMNNRIRRWVRDGEYSYLRLLDYSSLFENQLHFSLDRLHYNNFGQREVWNNFLVNTVLDSAVF